MFSSRVSDLNNVWSAFAFSKDEFMGDDNVCLCKISSSKMSIENYYNSKAYKEPILLDVNHPSIGFSNIKLSLQDDIFTCSFTRENFISNISNYFSMNNNYYLLFASGKITNGKLRFGLIFRFKCNSNI